MGRELFKKQISVTEYGRNLAYIIPEETVIAQGEYRMLAGCGIRALAKCMETVVNGQKYLVYQTHDLRPLASMLEQIKENRVCTIALDLLRGISAVAENGFLSCRNMDASFQHIFLHPKTFEVSLVYLPLKEGLYSDPLQYEHLVRTNLARVMMERGFVHDPACIKLLGALQSDLQISKIAGLLEDTGTEAERVTGERKPDCLKLRAEDASLTQDVTIERAKLPDGGFILGRDAQQTDGLITGSKAVGRRHLRIRAGEEGYYAEDLGSVNGTFLNGQQMEVHLPELLKNGDYLKVADVGFRVVL